MKTFIYFHFGMVDYERSTGKTADQSRIDAGWGKHLERREELFKIITTSQAHAWDDIIPRARKQQQRARQLFAWNKPKLLRGSPVVDIGSRFKRHSVVSGVKVQQSNAWTISVFAIIAVAPIISNIATLIGASYVF